MRVKLELAKQQIRRKIVQPVRRKITPIRGMVGNRDDSEVQVMREGL